jgi:ABC-type sugar transport system ATPase subunit
MSDPLAAALEVRGVSKSFSGVEVLHGVDLVLGPGSVHAIVGENGAGKSTLIKILSGVHRRDAGEIRIRGEPVEALSPRLAQDLGIITIYQERNLIPWLSVGENILLGNAPAGFLSTVKWGRLFERAQEILDSLNVHLDPRTLVVSLGAAEQQAVEIAKALYKEARIVIMDEPTASLSGTEIDNLFRLICQLKQEGVSIIYISHRLDEVFQVADRVTVLRDGARVGSWDIGQIGKEDLVKAMVGEELAITRLRGRKPGERLLDVSGLTRAGAFFDVNLTLDRGMVVGLAGMIGSGRTQLLRSLGGVEPVDGGEILLSGKPLTGRSLSEFIRRGVCFVPGERDTAGLILSMSVAGNTSLASLDAVTHGPIMNLAREKLIAEKYLSALDIQARGVTQEVQFLSGGNRQKVMLSKWLCRGLEVFLLDEPTQGVDVGAREEIHRIMKQLLDEGKGILMVSSDLDELLNMSHLIAVMARGRIVASLDTQKTSRQEVLSYAIGTTSAADHACGEA